MDINASDKFEHQEAGHDCSLELSFHVVKPADSFSHGDHSRQRSDFFTQSESAHHLLPSFRSLISMGTSELRPLKLDSSPNGAYHHHLSPVTSLKPTNSSGSRLQLQVGRHQEPPASRDTSVAKVLSPVEQQEMYTPSPLSPVEQQEMYTPSPLSVSESDDDALLRSLISDYVGNNGHQSSETGKNIGNSTDIKVPESHSMQVDSFARRRMVTYKRHPKPPYSYLGMIIVAIQHSSQQSMSLSEVVEALKNMFPFFRGQYQGWKDSVRHNLTQSNCLVKVPTPAGGHRVRGSRWRIDWDKIPRDVFKLQRGRPGSDEKHWKKTLQQHLMIPELQRPVTFDPLPLNHGSYMHGAPRPGACTSIQSRAMQVELNKPGLYPRVIHSDLYAEPVSSPQTTAMDLSLKSCVWSAVQDSFSSNSQSCAPLEGSSGTPFATSTQFSSAAFFSPPFLSSVQKPAYLGHQTQLPQQWSGCLTQNFASFTDNATSQSILQDVSGRFPSASTKQGCATCNANGSCEHLGPRWEHLGPRWEHLGPRWEHLGPRREHLGPRWEHLGPRWEPCSVNRYQSLPHSSTWSDNSRDEMSLYQNP